MSHKYGCLLLLIRYFVYFIFNLFNNPLYQVTFCIKKPSSRGRGGMFHHSTPLSANTPTPTPHHLVKWLFLPPHLPGFHANSKLKGKLCSVKILYS